jgi:hypothetical protein
MHGMSLSYTQVVNESGGTESFFYHSNWLDFDTPSVNIWRNNPLVDYTVSHASLCWLFMSICTSLDSTILGLCQHLSELQVQGGCAYS